MYRHFLSFLPITIDQPRPKFHCVPRPKFHSIPFNSGGRDKGRRKGETTGGDRQLRDGDRNEGRGGRGEGTEESVRRMEAEISQGPTGASKGTPSDAKCVTANESNYIHPNLAYCSQSTPLPSL